MEKLSGYDIEQHFFEDGFTLIKEIDEILATGYRTGELEASSDVYQQILRPRGGGYDCYEKRMMLSLSRCMFKNRQFCIHFSVVGTFDPAGYVQVYPPQLEMISTSYAFFLRSLAGGNSVTSTQMRLLLS